MPITWPKHTIFTYHEVVAKSDKPLSRYSVSTDRFADHLKLYRRLSETFLYTPRLTFDDGHSSNLEHAAPLLQRFDLTATFFLTAGFIGSRENFMGWSEVRALLAAGHKVEAHGWSHCFLTQCSDAELAHELADAKTCLEDRLGQPVTELSLPGGRYDLRVLLSAAKAGYRKVYSSEPWTQRPITGSLRLEGRAMVRRDTSDTQLSGLAMQTFTARSRAYTEHAARNGLRSLLGPDTYHALWTRLSRRQATSQPTSVATHADEHLSSTN